MKNDFVESGKIKILETICLVGEYMHIILITGLISKEALTVWHNENCFYRSECSDTGCNRICQASFFDKFWCSGSTRYLD